MLVNSNATMLGKVIGRNGDASRRAVALHRQVILPVAVLLLLAAAALAGLMLFNARAQDEIARDASILAMHEGIGERAKQLDRVVKDYAWWNEAVEAIQLRQDHAWAEARLGYYLHGTHKYDWAFVVAPDDSTFFAALEGEPVKDDISAALGNETWRQLVAAGRATPADEPEAIHAFLAMRDGQVGIASVTAITAESSWPGERPAGPRFVLLVIRGLTADWLQELAGALHLSDLAIGAAPAPPIRKLELKGPDGTAVQVVKDPDGRAGLLLDGPDGTTVVGQTVWQPHRPGTQYLRALLPSLCVALLLFLAFGWSALRQSRSSTSAIVESETRFRDVADASSDWIFETDAEGRLTWISDRFIALTGIPVSEIEGRPLADLLLPMSGDDLSLELGTALREQRLFRDLPRCYLDREGRPRILRVSGKPIRDAAARHVGWRGTAADVTVETEARKAAEFLSGHDALTGCLNRSGLVEGIAEVLEGTRRRNQVAAFLMLDVDGFKEVNDIYGPIVGDQLIHAVADRLATLAQPGDLVARPGADEFVLVRPAVADPQAAQTLARELQHELARSLPVDGQEITVSVSIAVIMLPTDATTAERALQIAGMVLSRAKEDGRAAIRFFEPGMDARLQARKALERDLARAIENREFEVFYQPKMNMRTRELSGVEALIRWRHPEQGLVAPGLFIPVAEETRMITAIGRWVLEQACRDASHWGGVQVAVNLSPAQFTDDNLLETVAHAIQHSGLPPAQLEVEITEGVLLANNARSNAMMNQFVEMGVHLAMDDFGTGYSSMSYLTKFRFNKIKIDRSFVQALDRGGEAIILAIVGMTKSLGIMSCAEGIETEEQMAALRLIGVDEMQGYWYGRPMPRADLVERFGLGKPDRRALGHAA
jgi:diguanylate cyclase (GGDEF)-like protein/PAS domain S-box-containing protein